MVKRTTSLKLDQNQQEFDIQGTPSFPIEVYFTDVNTYINRRIPIHWHKEIEILTVSNGKVQFKHGNSESILNTGQSAFINSGILHGYYPVDDQPCQLLDIVFDPEILTIKNSDFNQQFIYSILDSSINYKVINDPKISQTIKKIFNSSSMNLKYSHLEILTYLAEFWLEFYKNNQKQIHLQCNDDNRKDLQKILRYITKNSGSQINTKKMAQIANISERECFRLFTRTLDTTPHHYLLNFRLISAAKLLSDSNLNITQIAYKVGFKSPSYFSMIFRKYFKMSPKEFRNKIS